MADKVLHKKVIKSADDQKFCVIDYIASDASFFSAEQDAKDFIKTGLPTPDFVMTLSQLLEFSGFIDPKV